MNLSNCSASVKRAIESQPRNMNQKCSNKGKHDQNFIKITERISDRLKLNIFDLKVISIVVACVS